MLLLKRVALAATVCVLAAVPVSAHMKKSEPLQSIRQSYFALVGAAFMPMSEMVKGIKNWDQKAFEMAANDLAAVSAYNVERGFAAGSEKGKTRAKPDIWEDIDEFNEHLEEFRAEAVKLASVAQTKDRDAITEQFAATGKTCKGCHDEYKSKDYLY